MQQSIHRLHALFVGINQYAYIRPLNESEHDAERLDEFLKEYAGGAFEYHSERLLGHAATKSGIVRLIRKQLIRDDLKPGDALLFYFSGHGAEEKAASVFWPSEPNRKLQVLACYDSDPRIGKNFLADKELRYLLHQAAKPGVEVVTLFDCCHAGDNTRSLTPGVVRERLAGLAPQRDWNEFIFGKEITPAQMLQASLEHALPQGRHIQLAACDSHESAYEREGEGGFFTLALIQVLRESRGDLSYLDLRNRVKNQVRTMNLSAGLRQQTPQVYAFNGAGEDVLGQGPQKEHSLFNSFLGGFLRDKPIASNVYFNRQAQRWELDKGAIYGVTVTWQGLPQQVVVPVGEGKTTLGTIQKVFPGFSVVEFDPYADVYPGEAYSGAYVPSLMSRALRFSVTGDAAGTAKFREFCLPSRELSKKGLRWVGSEEGPEYDVLAKSGKFFLTLPGDSRPLTKPTEGQANLDVSDVLAHLKSIGRWAFLKNLKNPDSRIPNEAFDVAVSQYGQPVDSKHGAAYHLQLPEYDASGLPKGRMKLIWTNRSRERLYLGMVYLTSLFGIDAHTLVQRVQLIDPGMSIQRDGLAVTLPDYITKNQSEEEVFYVLLIAAGSEFSLDLLEQEDLEAPVTKGEGAKGISLRSIQVNPEDWRTHLLQFHIKNPHFQA